MRTTRFLREQFIERPLDEVFAFYADAANLERITPPWLNFRILTPLPIPMRAGTLIEYQIRLRGLPMRWQTRIAEWNAPHGFMDVQVRGPYRVWEHRHEFHAVSGGTLVRDTIDYALPAGWLGELVRRFVVSGDIEKIFDHRRRALMTIFALDSRVHPATARAHEST
ncbi:MAG TPA: SRPBCC family protein [Candidatus Krumholzibacteria bacterium]|nr:SRPBCC family protein [Candidatus Krumholzibacteria bacterium]